MDSDLDGTCSWERIWPDNSRDYPDSEKQDPAGPTIDEASSAKLWAVYVEEAQKYDKALVESWRSDMDGMLIFAGLFSASLTAFIIESYKTLNSDPGNMTVVLLRQISQQLAASANGSSFTVPATVTFAPPITSLVCNALWFISLGLSLSCALIATLLEQWARDFLHRADMRSAPVTRARIFSYLYYGLKRFSMHTVVEVIPLLLHASLIFFFAGLVAFLIPVNTIIMGISATVLALIVIVYAALTMLPLFYLDCPYRTPFSATLWRLLQLFRALSTHQRRSTMSKSPKIQPDTVTEAVFRAATEPSPEKAARDRRALIWTVKSLADESELEPFVDGIPEILWGPRGRRRVYDDYVMSLVSHPDVRLMARIEGLLRSAQSGLLSEDAATRRRITCLKAIWAISSLSEPDQFSLVQCDIHLVKSVQQTASAIVKP
ncbi:hypothetical protein DFH09DRAFT_970231 [Mycena vulgaris]|nr:hypothetical protein DFH09DRAFT_970231 [Mycena vulgaris]